MKEYHTPRKKEEREKTYVSIVENMDTKQTTAMRKETTTESSIQETSKEADLEDQENSTIAEGHTTP